MTDLARATPFWPGVLHPLGYGRTNSGPDWCLWAREGAQILFSETPTPTAAVGIMLRAPEREMVDRLHATAEAEGWRIVTPPEERPFAPGYYSCTLADPDGIAVEIVHALDELPERRGGERVRVPGADGVSLSGYLFRPDAEDDAPRVGVIVLHGYGTDARSHVLAAAGLFALSLSQRGWLGSTGDEDQGFRQPDDIVAAANWLRIQAGVDRVGLLGFSQGAQTALLAAARPAPQFFAAVVSNFAPTNLVAWAETSSEAGIADYLADFVPADRLLACSPLTVADRITCPVLLLHGADDTNVPVAQAHVMAAANSLFELRVLVGAGHGTPLERWAEVWPEALAFLIRNLAETADATGRGAGSEAAPEPLGRRVYAGFAERYAEAAPTKPHNALYERPATMELVGDVAGLAVLDAGCGPGINAATLAGKGAGVIAFDVTPAMVALARERCHGLGVLVREAALEAPLDRLGEASVDLVLCALALDYVADLAPVFREFHRVTRLGGALVFSMGHPMRDWLDAGTQAKGTYFDRNLFGMHWSGFGEPRPFVETHRRPLGEILEPLAASGWLLERLMEPRPAPDIATVAPRLHAELSQAPALLCVRARRDSAASRSAGQMRSPVLRTV